MLLHTPGLRLLREAGWGHVPAAAPPGRMGIAHPPRCAPASPGRSGPCTQRTQRAPATPTRPVGNEGATLACLARPIQTQHSAHRAPEPCIFLSGHQGVRVDHSAFWSLPSARSHWSRAPRLGRSIRPAELAHGCQYRRSVRRPLPPAGPRCWGLTQVPGTLVHQSSELAYSRTTVPPTASRAALIFSASALATLALISWGRDSTSFLA